MGYFLKHYIFKCSFYLRNISSGSLETTKVLLEAGADKGAQNKINKTAAQLGAFTGKIDIFNITYIIRPIMHL